MRIALVVPGGVDRSGGDRVIPCLLWLIEGLTRDGHDVRVFALWQEPGPGSWELLGAWVRNIGRRPAIPFTIAALIAEHRKARFDVIHAFWAQGCGVAAGIAGKLLGVPVVLTLAGGDLQAIPDIGYGGRLRWRGRVDAWLACRLARYVTTPSDWLRQQALGLGVDAITVPLGVARDHWSPSAPRPRGPSGPLRLVHVGSLNRVKDQPTLLRAARALRDIGQDFELAIVGADTLDGEMQALAARLGLDRQVSFVGFVPHERLRSLIERADLLVMTSRHEAGPLVTLEAAIAGVPTVGTAVGHIADFAPDAAVAVPVEDHAALAAAIHAIAQDEGRRMAIAKAAQVRALTIDANATVEGLTRLYRSAVGPSG